MRGRALLTCVCTLLLAVADAAAEGSAVASGAAHLGSVANGTSPGIHRYRDSTGAAAFSDEPGTAAPPAMKIYKYRNSAGVTSFTDRAPTGVRYEVVQLSCYACNPRSTVDWHTTPLHLNAYRDTIIAAARKYRVDPALVRAVIHAESAFRPGARSRKGATGLMQLMPDTARDMGVADILSPQDNIDGGVKYLAMLLQRLNGNTTLATAAYNAGPGAVERHGGIPPYEETQTYVKRVRILFDRYQQAQNKTFSGRHVSDEQNG